MKKVLLIGSSAREHIIAETLKKSRVQLFTFASSNNPGIHELSEKYISGNLADVSAIKEFALKSRPDFAIIGPENPIAAGVSDELDFVGVPCIAPHKATAQLESSKSFTRDILKEFHIPGNPLYRVFTSAHGIKEFMHELSGNFVVKADGLQGGKGVKVSGDHFGDIESGFEYAHECLLRDSTVIIEEKLVGQEFSLMSFVDGKHVISMPPVQDHKRAYLQDKGPNTGGMGSYSDSNHLLPFLESDEVLEAHRINQAVTLAIKQKTGMPYKGILYGGFMVTASGVKLIEYNVRFGDPEAMNVLPLLETDFVKVCEGICEGTLDKININFSHKATVCKYVVPEGYPDNPMKGARIQLKPLPKGVKRYFASVEQKDGDLYLGGSRAIAFVGVASSIDMAERLAQEGVETVIGPVYFRRDIGTESLLRLRIQMMKELRKIS